MGFVSVGVFLGIVTLFAWVILADRHNDLRDW
jgi:hypothetical protein